MTHASRSFISSNLWTQQTSLQTDGFFPVPSMTQLRWAETPKAYNAVFENHRRTNTGQTNKAVIRFPSLSSTKNPFSNTRLYQ